MIFLKINTDSKYQVNEKVRIDCTTSFLSLDQSALTKVEIDGGGGYVDLGAAALTDITLWYLDWQYSSAGTKTVSIRINSSQVESKTVEIVTSTTDALFSTDEDIITLEPDLIKWLPAGRSTWNYIHRKAQDRIMFELNKNKIYNLDGTQLLKTQILDKTEVKEWSINLALSFIFKGISNQTEDVFSDKALFYESKANESKEYCFNVLRLDVNKDSTIGTGEVYDFRSSLLVR